MTMVDGLMANSFIQFWIMEKKFEDSNYHIVHQLMQFSVFHIFIFPKTIFQNKYFWYLVRSTTVTRPGHGWQQTARGTVFPSPFENYNQSYHEFQRCGSITRLGTVLMTKSPIMNNVKTPREKCEDLFSVKLLKNYVF